MLYGTLQRIRNTKTGEVSKSYSDYHDHWDSMYAVLSIEPGTQWWMTRTNLFTSGDDNAFANKIASDPNVKKMNVSEHALRACRIGRGYSPSV